ncbi:MAG: DNA polymerase III subunit gamma/tau [Candidatus Ventricola sp.]|nr:DNA polymerase III subunit gamma/tau [Candidatus Ventricola sp.]MDY3831694.1 DNA polymerase III subunit gamma/tau [Candidatus Ventricola sp.]
MGYQALYRRYRPARFDDFVGQEAIIRTLRSQVMSGRIAHAYLFCGTRGTGKTSTAKVFARAVNCENPDRGEPCGQCAACRALSAESSLDILEIDAASNNGVDEIRDLREKVKYPPQSGRYRVYIIDEVHMLSQGAFNALLKTLEEPPAYVVFILATTEPQKLPATILSRCQRFDFGRIPAHQIIARLRVALEEGGIAAEEAALARIARAAEGGMRDAWSILDMCLGYAQEDGAGLTEALVLQVLGAADKRFLFEFADRLISADAVGALEMIDGMMRAGREVQVFVRDVSGHLRNLMLAGVCGQAQAESLLEVTAEDAQAYVEQAGRTSRTRLMRMLDLFLASETDMKWAAQPRFALEAATLRACEPEESLQLEALVARVDELERKLREGAIVAAPKKQTCAPADEAEAQRPAEAPKGPAPDAERIWQEAVRRLKQNPFVFNSVNKGRLISGENGLFTEVFDKGGGAIHVKLLSAPDKNAAVAEALSAAAGYPCTFRAALEGTVAESDKAILAAQQEAKKQADKNLSKVFDAFGRENVRVLDE